MSIGERFKRRIVGEYAAHTFAKLAVNVITSATVAGAAAQSEMLPRHGKATLIFSQAKICAGMGRKPSSQIREG